jgi:hypothetical protein
VLAVTGTPQEPSDKPDGAEADASTGEPTETDPVPGSGAEDPRDPA